MPKPENLLMSYIVCDMLSKSDQTVAHDADYKHLETPASRKKLKWKPKKKTEN